MRIFECCQINLEEAGGFAERNKLVNCHRNRVICLR